MSSPRPLRALIKNWQPSNAGGQPLRPDQALTQLMLAWTAAVGPQVAARSRPFRLQRGSLLVLTASSAWSDELSLLAPRILEALQHRCPEAGVRQLRFRVAGGRSKLLFESSGKRNRAARDAFSAAAQVHLPATPQQPPQAEDSADVQAIVAKLRALQEDLNRERDRSGWLICAQCGSRFFDARTRESLCGPCAQARRRALEVQIERALIQAPWLKFIDLASHVPRATRPVADRVRRNLLTRWESELHFAERRLRRGAITTQDRMLAWSYLMLLARLPQRSLGAAVVNDVLGSDWAAALLVDQRNTKREAGGPSQQK